MYIRTKIQTSTSQQNLTLTYITFEEKVLKITSLTTKLFSLTCGRYLALCVYIVESARV